MLKEQNKINIVTGFGPLVDKPFCTVTDYSKDKEILEYDMEEYLVSTGEKDTDFVTKKRPVVKSKVDRAKYIDSFKDDVGIMNILKKVERTGDATLLHQCKDVQFLDTTGLPQDRMDAFKALDEGYEAFAKLPDDIKGKMSMESFVAAFGQEKFDKYVADKVAEVIAKKEKVKEEQ